VEGNATASPVLRLSCLADELGPIKSVGLQVARRVSNFLRAGFGVSEYSELDSAQTILLKIPDSEAPRIVEELSETALPFEQMSFVLCESWLMTDTLAPLRRRGAQIASLVGCGPISQSCFVLEGDLAAVRKTKRLLERGGGRAIELRMGAKALYFAANLLSTAITVPVFQLAQQALRESGVSGNDLAMLLNDWSELLSDRIRKGGRATWGGPLAECSEEVANEHFRKLTAHDSALASTVDDWLVLAKRQMSKRAKGQSA